MKTNIITNRELLNMSNEQIEEKFKNRHLRFLYDGKETECFVTKFGVSADSKHPITGGLFVDFQDGLNKYDIFKIDKICIEY